MPDRTGSERSTRVTRAVFTLALFFTFTFLALLTTNFPTWGWPGGDGRDYANITEALVEGKSFDLRHSTRPVRRKDDPTIIFAENGSIYSIFPVGRALAQAPALAMGRWVAAGMDGQQEKMLIDNLAFSATSAILYGLSGCLIFLILYRALGFSFLYATAGTLLYCLATLAYPFSKIHGVESLQIVLLMCIVYWGLKPTRWSLAILCFSFGWLVVTKPPSAVALPVFLYLVGINRLWTRAHWPSRILAFTGTILFLTLFMYYNWLRAGDPTASYGVGQVAESSFSLSRVPGTLWPLFIGPERNLFLNNPILLLALPGLFMFRDSKYMITALGLWVTMLLLYGASGNTNWGAYVGNGRYAVPYIFLLIPFVVAALRGLASLKGFLLRSAAAPAVVLLLLASVYVQILYASFSEFHVKQYERTFNRYARSLNLPTLPEAKHQLRFAHTLFWSTDSCQHPSSLDRYHYPSHEKGRAEFAVAVLKTFPPVFFCKDYLFLNTAWFPGIAWLERLRLVLIALLLASALIALASGYRYRAKQRSEPGLDALSVA